MSDLGDVPTVPEMGGAIGRPASDACRLGQHDLCNDDTCLCRHHGRLPGDPGDATHDKGRDCARTEEVLENYRQRAIRAERRLLELGDASDATASGGAGSVGETGSNRPTSGQRNGPHDPAHPDPYEGMTDWEIEQLRAITNDPIYRPGDASDAT